MTRPVLFISRTQPVKRAFLTLTLALSLISCVKRPHQQSTPEIRLESAGLRHESKRININTASASELEKLPGIGKGLAERIIEHREKYGPFRKPAHLIIVRGISDKRFHALQDLITIE